MNKSVFVATITAFQLHVRIAIMFVLNIGFLENELICMH